MSNPIKGVGNKSIVIGNVYFNKNQVKSVDKHNNGRLGSTYTVNLTTGQSIIFGNQHRTADGVPSVTVSNNGKNISIKNLKGSIMTDNPKLTETVIFYGGSEYNRVYSAGGNDGIVNPTGTVRNSQGELNFTYQEKDVKKPSDLHGLDRYDNQNNSITHDVRE